MNNNELSDLEIERLLIGKWRFNTTWERISIQFKNDMTYEQTRVQTFILYKPIEFIAGNNFTGVWYVREGKLYLNFKEAPASIFNFEIPLIIKFKAADFVAKVSSLFISETYRFLKITNSKCIIKEAQKEETIIGIKIQ